MRVLVGVEGSDESETVLRNAIGRAMEADDDLTVAVFAKEEAGQDLDEVEAAARRELADADVEAAVLRLEGDPASALVELAEAEGFDQLVIGGGRRTPLGKRYLGRITEYVLLNADVPVRLER
ncbi:MAG: universal stress protein [Halobacteriales archaeon]